MPTLTDARYDALRILVPTAPPTTTDMLAVWLFTEGGTGSSMTDLWRSMLIGKGATPGNRNDMWMQVLALNGFTQPHINDRELAFWLAGGNLV